MGRGFSGSLVRIYSTSSITDGYLVSGRLEAEGIPVIVKGESEGPYRMGPAHVWVPEELEVQAKLLLAELRLGEYVLPEQEDVNSETGWDEAEEDARD